MIKKSMYFFFLVYCTSQIWDTISCLISIWCDFTCIFASWNGIESIKHQYWLHHQLLPSEWNDRLVWNSKNGRRAEYWQKPGGHTLWQYPQHLPRQRDNWEGDLLGLKPNGFTEVTIIKDYPIRNRKVLLHVRRRCNWNADGRNVILNQYPLTNEARKCPWNSFFKDGPGQPAVNSDGCREILGVHSELRLLKK